ncbi:penicillin-binding protein 1B [Thalassotalea ganghwensis]
MTKKTKTNSSKQALETSTTSKAPSKKRKLFILFIKVFLVTSVLIAAYTLYLDSKVVAKFEGQRWQIPVQVFGQVEQFSAGSKINIESLKHQLNLNGYLRVKHPEKPGEYALSSKRLIIYRRAFDFGEGISYASVLTINYHKNQVRSVFKDDQEVHQVALEPILLDRIIPENKEDRVLVPLQSVPELLLDTLLLVEDRNFYHHAGVSPLGILRALYQNIRAGRTVQGGSTLTQQLVKNMYLSREKSLVRKANEAIMALLLEYHYSKDQLLEAYINEVYLGQHYANGIYGFGLAAEFYFGRSLAQLSFGQMATLVAVIKGPSYYDPWRYQARTKERRDLILRLMFEQEYLTKAEYLTEVKQPLAVRKQRRFNKAKHKYPAYMQLVQQELSKILSQGDQQAGIRVFTTFSHHAQYLAEQSVQEKLNELEQQGQAELEVAMVVTELDSGGVLAVVGAKESGFAGFNRALNATRPIGSLIKPALYLAALERYQEYNLATQLDDKPLTIAVEGEDSWQPKNYNGKYQQSATLLESLVHSLNIPSVNLGMALGLDNVADVVHLLGYPNDITIRPSMLLGALNLSPFQVNQFYLPIARNGFNIQAHAIDKIISAQGETIWQFQPIEAQYFSTQASYLINYALNKVTTEGTARSLTWRVKNKALAGKTGTTNDQRDSWFVGYDQQTLVTTWIGNDENKATHLTGSSGALVLFADFINRYGVQDLSLTLPEGVKLTEFEQKTSYAVAQSCPNTIKLPAISAGVKLQYDCSEQVSTTKKVKNWLEKLFGI